MSDDNKLNVEQDSSSLSDEKELTRNKDKCFPMMAKMAYNPPLTQILSFLYVGNSGNAHNRKLLESHDISALLCLKDKNYEDDPKGYEFLFIPMKDDGSTDIFENLDVCINYIRDMGDKNKKILVYCRGGLNRSVIIIMAYLMKYNEMNLKQAYEHVYALRPQIEPKKEYINQLKNFEESLYGIRSDVGLHNLPINERVENYRNSLRNSKGKHCDELKDQKVDSKKVGEEHSQKPSKSKKFSRYIKKLIQK